MTLHRRPVELPAKPDQEHALTTWWASATCQQHPPAFYAMAHERLGTLRAKYGSAIVATSGELGPDFGERARRVRQVERERLERLSR